MKQRILLFLLMLLIMAPLDLWAQTVTVTGTVTDAATNTPLPGVSVHIDGTSTGGVTGADGNYQLSVSDPNATLVFSYIGYTTQKVQLNGRSEINIQLGTDAKALEEVVVVGYGTQRKADLTSAISTVDAEDLENLPVTGVEQALQGRAAGVTVTTASGIPGAPVSVRIRGIGTVNNSNPLYIVDGVPVGDMNYLNPSDIASIQILKDASAAAIYGSRAANGVVLITTKKGKEGKPQVSFDAYYGLSKPWQDFEPAGRDEYLYMVGAVNGENSSEYTKAKAEYDRGYSTNWWKEAVKTAAVQNYNLNISGGSEKAHYSVSGAYFDQQGSIEPSGYSRLSARINTDYSISNRITVGENLSISNEIRENTIPDILQVIEQYDPLVPAIDPNRDQTDPYSKWGGSDITFGSSALGRLSRVIGESKTLRLMGNVYGNVDILNDLVFTSNFGFDIQRGESNSFSPIFYNTVSDLNNQAAASAGSNSTNGWNWSNTLTWGKTLGDHSFNILAGTEANYATSHWVNGSRYGQPGNEERFQYIDAGTYGDKIYGSANESSLNSYFGRASYNYKDKYLFSSSIRRDGSSHFAEGHRWGTFPSFSAGWVISEESFWANLNLPWFSRLKLRGGWGQLGNQNIAGGAYTTFVAGGNNRRYVFGQDGIVQGYAVTNTGNSLVQWETNEQTDIGLEFGLLNNALTIETDYYNRKTKDMLIAYPVASTFGASSPWVNAGNVLNRGFELSANYYGNIGELEYNIGGNVSHYKNEVTNLGEGQPYVESIPQSRVSGTSRTAVGHPIGEFYGWKTDGIFQSQQEVDNYINGEGQLIQPNAGPGDLRFVDVNGDGSINADDKTNIGSPHPKLTYGGNLSLNYRDFDLSLFIQGSYGNKIFNINKYTTDHPLGFDNVRAGVVYEAWTSENGSTSQPIMSKNDPNDNFRTSDWYVEDGSYMRIKNMQIGYSLPSEWLSSLKMTQFRIYLAAQNLFTFTKYSGLDPEIGVDSPYIGAGDVGLRQRLAGVDYFNFPQSRTFQLGVNLKF